jgi:hypothetical protein
MLLLALIVLAGYALCGLVLLFDPLAFDESPADILKRLKDQQAKEQRKKAALLERDRKNGKA